MTTTPKNLNVSLVSHNVEWLSETQNKIKEQAKLQVFESLDFDKRSLSDINSTISEIKEIEKDDSKSIDWLGAIKVKYKTLKKKYNSIFEKYKNAGKDEKELIYMELAERVILNRWWTISYKDWESIWKQKITKDFVNNEYKVLNAEYDNKLDLFTVKDKDWKLYLVRRKADELRKIKEREEQLKDEEIERLQKDNKNSERSNTKKPGWEDNTGEEVELRNEKDRDVKDLIKRLMEDSEEKDKKNEARFTKLEELLKNKDKNIDEESEDTNEENINKEDNKSDDELENSEIFDENSNYISRNFVEWLVFWIRWAEGYPKWTIKIREELINVEEFEFYEEFKQEYIEAKWDTRKLSALDKEFAEMVILFSPKWAENYKDKYCIKLSEKELKDWLYVSDERLARYWVSVKVSEYFEKVVEKEVIREKKVVKKIEKEIQNLDIMIIELTKKIDIEKYSKEETIKEIKLRKARLLLLLKKLKQIRSSLKSDNKKIVIEKIVDDKENKDRFIETFSDANGSYFKEYCDKNWITREDGKDIDWKRGLDPYTTFISKDWDILKLKPHTWANLFDENGDYDDYSGATRYDLVYTWKKKIKETVNKKDRVVINEFDDSDGWAWFAKYCAENWIKRKDGKDISRRWGMDTSITYIDKDWKELKLEWINWAEQHDDVWGHTKYELVYYDESWNWEWSELEDQLNLLIEEWEALLVELTELEKKLIIAKTGEEKAKIKEKIKIINQKLVIISQKYSEFEQFIHIYKSKTTIKNYKIFQIIPLGPNIIPNQPFEMTSVISDMGTDVFKEKAALKVEEQLKRQYKSLWRWQMWSRLALFLWRWSKRKKMMKKEMNNMANTAFQTNAAYATLNEQSQNAADRHGHELLTSMAAVNRITTVHNDEIDKLCKDYLNNLINDDRFQQRFNTIVAADANIQNALNGQNITHIGTNILLQLKERKALNTLITTLDWQLSQYITTGNSVYMHNMQNYVEQYIKDYQKLPAFKVTFEQFLKWDLNARNQLRRYLSHQKAIMNMQITNLRMNIDILNKGKSAYQIDNKDREKWWKYKVWHFMDKHPWWTAIGSVALWVWLWVVTAPLSAVAWAAVTTWVFGSYVWFTNYIKKWTHHTKEQNTHEKNVVTDYRNEQAKIQNWQNLALNGSGRKKYKAKRQLALYDQTTQENIKLSDQITEYITNLSAKTGPLTADEDNFMRLNLIEWWARLKYYRAMWHNFLASENVDKTEKDMRRLEKSITLWLQKIGKNTNDIETTMTATNGLWTNITYAVIQNDLKASYDKSLIQFKRERRNLALKYGISTAALSIGTALGMQYLMWTWVFAKWKIECPDAELTAVKDNFALWKAELLDGSNSVYVDSKNAFSSITQNGTKLNLWYWAWTDGTHVIPWRLTASDLFWWSGRLWKIPDVKWNIDALVWSNGFTQAHADVFKHAVDSLPSGVWTNGVLQNMRQAEWIEQRAKALVSSGKSSMINPSDITIAYDPSLDVIWTTNHTLADRVFNWVIEIAWPCKETEAPKWWRWLMWVPLFFNTFKDRKSTKDTTDQKFWQWNNHQRPQQPNQRQPNQNQPHNP